MKREGEGQAFQWLKVPADWAVIVCREKCFREAQVLLWIKCKYSGYLGLNPRIITDIGKSIGASPKTVRRAIAKLEERSWIGSNKSRGIVYPRSFETIRLIESIPSRKAFLFNVRDIRKAKGFLVASAISIYLNRKEFSIRNNRRGTRVRHIRIRSIKRDSPAFVPICNLEVAKYLSISISTASTYKELGVKQGFLKRKRILEKFSTNFQSTWETIGMIRKYRPDLGVRVRLFQGEILIQKSDEIASLLQRCKRKGQKPIFNTGYSKGKRQQG